MFGDLIVFWIVISLNYILLATGLTLVFSIMRIINLAHGHIYMAGAFLFFYFLERVGLPYGIALLLSMVIVGGWGVIIETYFYRRLSGSLNAQIVCMIGLMMIMEGIVQAIFGSTTRDIPSALSGTLTFGTVTVSVERATVAVVSLLVMAALFYFVKYTKPGKAMRATAQDRYAASLMGVPVNLTTSLTMGIGCAMAALAGTQIAAVYYISPFMGYSALLTAIVVVVLGGMGSVIGACVGAFIIGFINTFGAIWVGGFTHLLSFGAVILILLLRPIGLFGVSVETAEE